MLVVLVSPDLMAASQIASAVASVDGEFRQVSSTVEAAAACIDPIRNVVLIDLSARGTEVAESVATLRKAANPVTIIAYAPHVHTKCLEHARAAGCDKVLSRGQVHRELRDALQKIISS